MKEKEYLKFMNDPENSHRCDECPENNGCSNWQNKLPCGQWKCWVDLHCENKED